ncbi:MAG: VapC toxin family PIN domain ribonuclease [Aquificaceae bacterium]|nr:MAG: VapC toxin family PIN domain ribonuclease [Aquificaceae bacterium]
MKYLLDTNICIYIIKRKPREVIERFLALEVGDIAISSVSTSELYYGASKSQRVVENTNALNEFLMPIEVLSYNEASSVIYGEIRARLERKGQVIGAMDMMIAAHALSLNIPVVTNNVKEFERVEGLMVENWVNR